MSNSRNTGFLTNVIKVDATGNVSFVSGSTTLATISTSGQMSGSLPALSSSYALSASYVTNAETLDGLDSTVFTLTSSFNTTSASLYTVSSSAYATSGSLSATSGSLSAASGSLNTRVSALEVTGSALSSSILSVSASSYSTSGSLSSASGSFNTRISTVESKYATTGSNTFIGTQIISGSILQSGSFTSTGTLTAQTLVVQTITSSVVYSSGSNIFGNSIGNSQVFTGSVNITGSLSLNSITIPTSASLASTYLQLAGGTLTGDLSIAYTTSNLRLFLNNTTATTGRSWYLNSFSNGNLYIGNTTASDVFNFSSAGAATFSSTITGTTIYGSTAVCSPVGKFTSCIDAGSGTFSGVLTATGGTINGLLTINRNITGLVLNRDAVTNYNGIYYSTAVCSKWFIGMRENLCSNNHIHYSEQLGQDILTLNVANGAATFSSTITGTTIYGSAAVCSPVGLFSGCVGIGTTDPYTKLQVNSGNISVLSSCSIGTDGAVDVRRVGFGFKHPDNTVISALINTSAAGTWGLNLHFNVRGGNAVMPTIPAITIVGADDAGNNGGRVGIGTCSPAYPLTLAASSANLAFYNTFSNAAIRNWAIAMNFVNLGDMSFMQSNAQNGDPIGAGTVRMHLNYNGNVGIGTTGPTELLHVSGSIRVGSIGSVTNFAGTSPYVGVGGVSPLFLVHSSGYGVGYFGYDNAGDRLIIATDNGGGNNKIDFSVNAGTTADGSANNICGIAYSMRINGCGYITKPYQPAFKAGKSTNSTVNASCVIIFNDTSTSHHFNVGGHYSTSTGIFTAPVDGVYIFSVSVIYQNLSNGQAMDDAFYIYKNNDNATYSFKRAEYEAGYTGNGGYYVDNANVLLKLVATDAVKVVNNRQLEIHGNTSYTWFYGYLLG